MAARKTAEQLKQKVELGNQQATELRAMQLRQKELGEIYKKQEAVEVTISPMYRPHFGNQMPVSVNGILIYVPCNGKAYKIPKTFAGVVRGRIKAVDDQIKRNKKLSAVAENVEQYAGEKQLIQRA